MWFGVFQAARVCSELDPLGLRRPGAVHVCFLLAQRAKELLTCTTLESQRVSLVVAHIRASETHWAATALGSQYDCASTKRSSCANRPPRGAILLTHDLAVDRPDSPGQDGIPNNLQVRAVDPPQLK